MWTHDMFGVEKPIIALLHLEALPGDPGFCGSVEAVLEHAGEDLLALQEGGVDGILFANEFSLPYQPVADIATISTMAYIIGSQKKEIRVPYGVNVVKNPIATIELGAATGAHPDLRVCSLGPGRGVLRAPEMDYAPEYPRNAAWCAVFLDKYMIHNPSITAEPLLRAAAELGLTVIPVKQGYAKCSCVVVDGSSVITADRGMITALKKVDDIDLLEISPGHVLLPGHDTGFLGGASGLAGGELVFNGDISSHPDYQRIMDFAGARGVPVRYFPGVPLMDVGSLVEEPIAKSQKCGKIRTDE